MVENNLEMDMKNKSFYDTTIELILNEENLQLRLVETSPNLSLNNKFYCVLLMEDKKVREHKHYTHSDEGLTEATKFYEGLKCQQK